MDAVDEVVQLEQAAGHCASCEEHECGIFFVRTQGVGTHGHGGSLDGGKPALPTETKTNSDSSSATAIAPVEISKIVKPQSHYIYLEKLRLWRIFRTSCSRKLAGKPGVILGAHKNCAN